MSIFDVLRKPKIKPEEAGKISEHFMHAFQNTAYEKLDKIDFRLNHLEIARQSVSKGEQMLLTQLYKDLASRGTILDFREVGFRNFSQYEEDGILHYIFSLIGYEPETCVEFCAGIGYQSISANLILNNGWRALLVDGDEKLVKNGVDFFSRHPSTETLGPIFLCRWIDRDSVNDILTDVGFRGDIGLLTIDLDGVDYWIWEAITTITPRVVVIEYQNVLLGQSVTVPYHPRFKPKLIPLYGENVTEKSIPGQTGSVGSWIQYGGASLGALCKLGKNKGYRLIGTNRAGSNAFFLREDTGQEFFPERTCESCERGLADDNAIELSRKIFADYDWQEI